MRKVSTSVLGNGVDDYTVLIKIKCGRPQESDAALSLSLQAIPMRSLKLVLIVRTEIFA